MKLKVISSSSKGNCYLLQSAGGDTLIIECGIPIDDIKKALNFNIKNVVGCVVTHEHNDHARSLRNIADMGIRVYAPNEALIKFRCKALPFTHKVLPGGRYKIGNFTVMSLPAYHDVPCVCYVIKHDEIGRLLFVTDTYKMPWKIKNLNHLMIECNYCDDVLSWNEEKGNCPANLRERLMLSHMELKTTELAVKANVNDSLQDITLLHLSNDNSDAEHMRKTISASSGIPVYVAEKGLEIDFNNEPY